MIFVCSTDITEKTPPDDFISPEENVFYDAVPLSKRSCWLAGRFAAKNAIRQYYIENFAKNFDLRDIKILSGKSQKPTYEIVSSAILGDTDISISHSQRIAIAAVSDKNKDGLVGVDVERVRDFSQDMLEFFLLETEMRQIDDCLVSGHDKALVHTLFWSLKEAFLKALGVGLLCHPREVRIQFDKNITRLYYKGRQIPIGEKHYFDKNYALAKINVFKKDLF